MSQGDIFDCIRAIPGVVLVMFWEWLIEQNWFHPVVLVFPVIAGGAIIAGYWKLALFAFPVEMYCATHHLRQHHPDSKLSTVRMTVYAAVLFFAICVYIRMTGI
jgi:hypothetical protein